MFVQSNGVVINGGKIYAAFFATENVRFNDDGWNCSAN
jgi:hypothetical protein